MQPKYTGTIPKARRSITKQPEPKTRPQESFMVPPTQQVQTLNINKETAPPHSTPFNQFQAPVDPPTKPTNASSFNIQYLNIKTVPVTTTETQPLPYRITPYPAGGVSPSKTLEPNMTTKSGLTHDDIPKSFYTIASVPSSPPQPIPITNPVERTQSASTKGSSSLGVLPPDVDLDLMNTLQTLNEISLPNFGLEELEAYLRLDNSHKLISDSSVPTSTSEEENSTGVKRNQRVTKKRSPKTSPQKSKKDGISLRDFIEREIRSSESSGGEQQVDDIILYITSAAATPADTSDNKKARASTPQGDFNPSRIENLLSFDSNLSTISSISKHINERQSNKTAAVAPPRVTNADNYASSTHSST